jgi:Amino acid kinase family
MSKNGVDGVYTTYPRTDPQARKLDSITFDDALRRGLKVVDAALVFTGSADGERTACRRISTAYRENTTAYACSARARRWTSTPCSLAVVNRLLT